MQYWKQVQNEYILSRASLMMMIRLILVTVLIVVAFAFTPLYSPIFWIVVGLGAVIFLKAFLAKNQKICIDTDKKIFGYPTIGLGGGMQYFSLQNFSRTEVLKVDYAHIPMAVEVYIYFFDENGKEKKFQLRQKPFSNATAWAQKLVDETEKLIHTHK